ncbi:hypothetical protein GOQ29_11975 [Clostridium sp. D2Q-14]|uniref:CBO2463/CBO2479 domain-containing protein n=1 Tax=Anaeromonas gelatinilytica TaxID=2683194 RepID=UPI00193BD152|nr:CBO2463/CBO2479 domain-containing protein [Anaeromonas gelatinilytica]MBS4536334.1 hypothetical protein [Anaeromonas gelatinilytica]
MDKLKYISTESYYEGIIIEVTDAAVVIDFKGRLGQLKVPRRMVISNNDLKVGQQVGFLMTFPEVISEEIDEDYAESAKRQLEARRKAEKRNEK